MSQDRGLTPEVAPVRTMCRGWLLRPPNRSSTRACSRDGQTSADWSARPASRRARVAQALRSASTFSSGDSAPTTTCTWLLRTLRARRSHWRRPHVLLIEVSTACRFAAVSSTNGAFFMTARRRRSRPSSRSMRGSPKSRCSRSTEPRGSPWSQVPYVRKVRKYTGSTTRESLQGVSQPSALRWRGGGPVACARGSWLGWLGLQGVSPFPGRR